MLTLIASLQTSLRALALASVLFSSATAWSLPAVFNVHVEGSSDIVGVLDPTGPVVQIQTVASGLGTLGPLRYFSGDEVNLGNGQGAGRNRFVAEDGSELFGTFTVQLVPTADPAVLELFGDVDFIGGSGRFTGADGFAHFTGEGRFITPSSALSSFDFSGEVLMVDEPATAALLLAGFLALHLRRRQHRGTDLDCRAHRRPFAVDDR